MSTDQHDDLAQHGAGAELRRMRPRTHWALGDKERRARPPAEQSLKPAQRSARTIAQEQLAHIREITEEQAQPLVIDLVKLDGSEAAQAVALRQFTDDIVSRRRNAPRGDLVFVREEDLDVLAELLGCRDVDVTPLLGQLGVLAD
jgi:hypothetical protein